MAEDITANAHTSSDKALPMTVKVKTEKVNDFIKADKKVSESNKNHSSTRVSSQQNVKNVPNVSSTTNNFASNPVSSEQDTKQNISLSTSEKEQIPKSIDYRSKLGQFGWEPVGNDYLPFIMRGEDDRFTAVRMIECALLSNYINVLPWTVFTCTNIKSYYITENEAKLLNEINSLHSDFDYGYQTFSTKDVIIRLRDAIKFHKFLESCRTRLDEGYHNPEFEGICGFVMVNCIVTPYIKKGKKRYVLYDMVCTEALKSSVPEAKFKVTEWDLSYFRFLSSVTKLNQAYFIKGASFCSLEDLRTVLGVEQFTEWWPDVQYSSKSDKPMITDTQRNTFSHFLSFTQSKTSNSQVLRDKYKESQTNKLNSFYKQSHVAGSSWQSSEAPHAVQSSQSMQTIGNDDKESLFPSSLERLLGTSNQPISYDSHFNQQMQSFISSSVTSHLGSESGLSSLATSRPKPYPPPPPLVRVSENSQSTAVPVINHTNGAKNSSLYPYMHSVVPPSSSSWLSHMLDSQQPHQSSEFANVPMTHSRILNGEDPWNIGSSNALNAVSGASSCFGSYSAFCRDDRFANFPRSSPRPAASAGGPPYYPTPPQSSPLQPPSVLDCPPLPGITDIYGIRTTPHGLGDMCSPPPSPETRTTLSNSPRGGAFGANSGYPAHITRLAQVDTRYLLAINVEPYKHNSVLAVPISDVVSKFLRDTSIESCQAVLESVFGLQLHNCTGLHQETYAKHNVTVEANSKLVSVVDLRNYLCQLRFVLAEREKLNERNYDMGPVNLALPMSKRWCGEQQGLR